MSCHLVHMLLAGFLEPSCFPFLVFMLSRQIYLFPMLYFSPSKCESVIFSWDSFQGNYCTSLNPYKVCRSSALLSPFLEGPLSLPQTSALPRPQLGVDSVKCLLKLCLVSVVLKLTSKRTAQCIKPISLLDCVECE